MFVLITYVNTLKFIKNDIVYSGKSNYSDIVREMELMCLCHFFKK